MRCKVYKISRVVTVLALLVLLPIPVANATLAFSPTIISKSAMPAEVRQWFSDNALNSVYAAAPTVFSKVDKAVLIGYKIREPMEFSAVVKKANGTVEIGKNDWWGSIIVDAQENPVGLIVRKFGNDPSVPILFSGVALAGKISELLATDTIIFDDFFRAWYQEIDGQIVALEPTSRKILLGKLTTAEFLVQRSKIAENTVHTDSFFPEKPAQINPWGDLSPVQIGILFCVILLLGTVSFSWLKWEQTVEEKRGGGTPTSFRTTWSK